MKAFGDKNLGPNGSVGIYGNRQPVWLRMLYRFVLCYLSLYCLDLLGDLVSFCSFMALKPKSFPDPFTAVVWRHLVPWMGEHVFRLGVVTPVFGGSSDTLFAWVQVLCVLTISFVGAVVWSALDTGRRRERVMYTWLRIAARMLLAAEMILYGMDKVYPVQFHVMTLSRMMQPMSAKTPMGVLWDFMAASVGYTIFTGAVEVVGGALLLRRRWTTLGALICAGAMVNVFALNLAYDVPVKLKSFHLLLVSIFLLASAMPRLLGMLVLNKSVEPEVEEEPSRRAWVNKAAVCVPVVVCVVTLVLCAVHGAQRLDRETKASLPHSDFYGVWDFVSLDVADVGTPLLTDRLMKDMEVTSRADRWRRVIFEGRKSAEVELGNGVLDHVDMKEQGQTITITDSDDDAWMCVLTVVKSGPDAMTMDGMG